MPMDVDRLRHALADRYVIEREIGRGGTAIVYLARDIRHHRQVAVKVLRPELAAALGTSRFHHEIETAAPLSHPHILPVYNSGEADWIDPQDRLGLLAYNGFRVYVSAGMWNEAREQVGRLKGVLSWEIGAARHTWPPGARPSPEFAARVSQWDAVSGAMLWMALGGRERRQAAL